MHVRNCCSFQFQPGTLDSKFQYLAVVLTSKHDFHDWYFSQKLILPPFLLSEFDELGSSRPFGPLDRSTYHLNKFEGLWPYVKRLKSSLLFIHDTCKTHFKLSPIEDEISLQTILKPLFWSEFVPKKRYEPWAASSDILMCSFWDKFGAACS